MAQGYGKVQKKKHVPLKGKAKDPKKGRRTIQPKRKHAMGARQGMQTTKAINQKNEASIAAKAVASGTQFFLTDINKSGNKNLAKSIRQRNKKEGKVNHLQKQLKKLQK